MQFKNKVFIFYFFLECLKYESKQWILVKTLSLNITKWHFGQVVVSQLLSDQWVFILKKSEDCPVNVYKSQRSQKNKKSNKWFKPPHS